MLFAKPLKVNDPSLNPQAEGLLDDTVNVCNGLTVMVNVVGVPAQPEAVGVTVIVAVTALAVAFVAMNAAILPVPFAARPILVVLFVQV